MYVCMRACVRACLRVYVCVRERADVFSGLTIVGVLIHPSLQLPEKDNQKRRLSSPPYNVMWLCSPTLRDEKMRARTRDDVDEKVK